MVAIVGSWGYLCMGTVRGWGSPGLPSLNRTLDFEMDEDDFKWICMNNFVSCKGFVRLIYLLCWNSCNTYDRLVRRVFGDKPTDASLGT